ncbi:Major facilitator superfamily transporter [Tolypocladium paradoxum]|uniref:Major facilitator superfamily transporter n=1 Tax=Tolypocladium paradoxum TaxID=94208 RepID=A0A2S4KQ66_9HYPO|nr:Major facilitator superfamily transporter [Tolypocladium paradoxum]
MATYIYKKFFSFSKDKSSPTISPPCSHRDEPLSTPCLDCKAEKSAVRKYRWRIILGLIWPYALQALDATMLDPSLCAADVISQQNWIVSAFNLTSAAFIPFWAQMADVFGRYAAITAAVLIMLMGSALCTGAPTDAYAVLLLGRGFQGLASAGLNVVVRTILADRVTLRENAKNWAIFALVGGISYALGPVIGGYLTSANWRWCFGINLPVGAVALLVIFFVLRKELLGPQPIPELDETAETGRRTKLVARLKTIDVGGQALFVVGFGLIILGLTWGVVTYPWESPAVIVSLVVGCLFAGCFFVWERMLAPGRILSRKMPWQRPMIPWALLTNRDLGLIFYTECATGMAMFSVLYFCNIYFIAVKGNSSDKAGLQLLYFTPGIGVGVYLCMFFCNRWPRMTFPPLFLGTTIEMVGVGVLAWAIYMDRMATILGMMALVGCGMGLRFMVAPLHGIGIFKSHRASVIGLMAVAVPFGGTIGLTIMSTVFNNTSGLDAKHSDFSSLQDQPDAMREQAIYDAKMGVVWAFVAIVPFMVISWFCCFFLGNVILGGKSAVDEEGNQDFVINEPYLWSLLRGRHVLEEAEKGIRLESSHRRERFKTTSDEDSPA